MLLMEAVVRRVSVLALQQHVFVMPTVEDVMTAAVTSTTLALQVGLLCTLLNQVPLGHV